MSSRMPGEHRERAQRAEHPADAGGVADGLPQPVPRRDLEVDDVASMPPTWIMLMTKSAPSRAARRSSVAVIVAGWPSCSDNLRGRALRDREPLGVDVVQREVEVEVSVPQQVGDQLTGEDDAPGADECDLRHSSRLSRKVNIPRNQLITLTRK